ncbi:MerR family DNA-binding protein [Halomonas llamarensis]
MLKGTIVGSPALHRRCRKLGFSLDQVRDLLALSSDTEQSWAVMP